MRLRIVAIAVVSLGCAASINPYSNVTYEDPGGVSVDSVAILPVVAGQGLEGFRRLTADSVEAKLGRQDPTLRIIPADSSLSRLNEAGLASQYHEMVDAYTSTGVLDQKVLRDMADAVGTNLLLHTSVSYGSETDVNYGGEYVGAYETEAQDIGLFAHLWSASKGDVVWESKSGARSVAGYMETSRGVEEILNAATQALVDAFPLGG